MSAPPASASAPSALAGASARDLELLFDQSLDLLCVAGLDGWLRHVNPSWTRVLGWTREELLSHPVVEFMHPEDRERTLAARARLARGDKLEHFENRYLCKDGSVRWLSWQSNVDLAAGRVFAIARDITEQRRRQEARVVEDKLASTGVLAGGIAHDFNNLLAGLSLNLEMISMLGPVNDDQRRLLQRAAATVNSAQALTHQLLAFARIDAPESVRQLLDLAPLLRLALEQALAGTTLGAACEITGPLPPVSADEEQLGQVFRHLVRNARESMPAGGTVRIRAAALAAGDPALSADLAPAARYVVVRVSDTGEGIAPDLLPRVFDPYFSTKPRGAQKGMGLGLAICHAVIQRHGGAISVESAEGRGTTVNVFLPAA